MKKGIISLITAVTLCTCGFFQLTTSNITYAQQPPAYAKWGVIAVEKTKEKYPNSKVVDYLHVGRKQGPKTSTEQFKLWLKDDQKEFGVFVDIEFDNKTEKMIKINYRETTR